MFQNYINVLKLSHFGLLIGTKRKI